MQFGTLSSTDAPERKARTALKRNQVMLQWRCKKSEPHLDCQGKHWHNHSAIEKDGAKERVRDFNLYSPSFDYRIRPEKKAVDTTGGEAKVAV
jgi:hypothetical protein